MAAQKPQQLTENNIWDILMKFNNRILSPQFANIQEQISLLEKRTANIEKRTANIEKSMATKQDLQDVKDELQAEIYTLRKFLTTIEGSSRQEYLNLKTRVDRIEARLNLSAN